MMKDKIANHRAITVIVVIAILVIAVMVIEVVI